MKKVRLEVRGSYFGITTGELGRAVVSLYFSVDRLVTFNYSGYMGKSAIIVLLSISILLQNTCLMGAAGQSILFRALNKGCPMHCRLSCRAKSTAVPDNDGVKSYKKNIEQENAHAICYFQLKAEEIVATSEPSIAHGLYLFSRQDPFKSPFLDPPAKPPNFGFSV